MKRICSLLVVCVLALSMLCACGKKFKSVDADTVMSVLETKDYYDESCGAPRDIQGIPKLSTTLNNHWIIVFVNFGDKTEMCDYEYEMEFHSYQNVTRTDDGNYSIAETENDKIYRLFIRVDNSYLALQGPADDKEDMRDLARDIGYYE